VSNEPNLKRTQRVAMFFVVVGMISVAIAVQNPILRYGAIALAIAAVVTMLRDGGPGARPRD
jgi:disulfide bond formation protein DsbB